MTTSEPQPPYTPSEFHQAVLSANPRTAVFDCDGTLWAPDSGFGFMVWTLEAGLPAELLSPWRRAWINTRYHLYEAGQVDEATICGEMVQLYAGVPASVLEDAARTYVRIHIAPYIYPEMAALATALHQAGTELWAVSSTNRWVIQAGLAAAGAGESPRFAIPAQRILAADVAIEAGLATDRLLAVPTDEAKQQALLAAGLPHPDAVFGNSIHDAAMLTIARRPYPINANHALTELAHQRSWRIFNPSDTGWQP